MMNLTKPALRTIPANQLPPQIFIGAKPSRDAFEPARYNPRRSYIKKPNGGLWTSTLDDDGSCDWVRWCRAEEWGDVDRRPWWRLRAITDAPVIEIDTYADLERLMGAYGMMGDIGKYLNDPNDPSFRSIDFDALIRDGFIGVHLTEQGQQDTRYSLPYTLYGWDCECTIWFDWAFGEISLFRAVEEEAA